MVGERGIKLSAGQKQRLNLIRGILMNKDLYIFDEPTSCVINTIFLIII
ncbi:MAG: ATP-binding cassette domain-containing protein [Clostridia bacterium]|jgi:ABC transporter|nr:ATP-binding cassette domain-containing protein [Clostridia bacterium]